VPGQPVRLLVCGPGHQGGPAQHAGLHQRPLTAAAQPAAAHGIDYLQHRLGCRAGADLLRMQRQRQRQLGHQCQQQCGNQAAGVYGRGGVGGRHERLSRNGMGQAGISICR